MSSLQSEAAVSAHAVALAILVHAFVTRRLVNQRRRERRAEKEEARRANREQRRQVQLQQQQQQAVQQTPDKRAQSLAASPAAAAAAAASPAPSGDGSFFASPTSSSTGGGEGGSEQGTPAPVSFNLGLGLGPNAAPFNLGLALGLAAGDGLPGQTGPAAAAPSPEEVELARQRKEESWARFPQRDYIQLGLFLHKAVQNGCVYDPAAFASPSAAVEVLITDPSAFPHAPPRFPSLAELRALLLSNLPRRDDFAAAAESYLLDGLRALASPDDLLELLHSLQGLVLPYSHKVVLADPVLGAPPLRALDRNSTLGVFVRETALSLEAGLFDALASLHDSVRRYISAGGLVAEGAEDGAQPEASAAEAGAGLGLGLDADAFPPTGVDEDELMDDESFLRTPSSFTSQQQRRLHPNISARKAPAGPALSTTPGAVQRALIADQNALLAQMDSERAQHVLGPEEEEEEWLQDGTATDAGGAAASAWRDPWLAGLDAEFASPSEVGAGVGVEEVTGAASTWTAAGATMAASGGRAVPADRGTSGSAAESANGSGGDNGSHGDGESDFVPATALAPFLSVLLRSHRHLTGRLAPGALVRLVHRIGSLPAARGGQLPLVHHLLTQAHLADQAWVQGVESSFRYYDYYAGSAAREAEVRAAAAQEDEEGAGLEAAGPHRRRRALTHQYASLALAGVHAHFGHVSACLSSLRETVRLAQQHKDETCLRFAVALLQQVVETRGGGAGGGGAAGAGAAAGGSGGQTASLLHRALITQANASARQAQRTRSLASASPGTAGQSAPPLPELDAANALALARFECTHVDSRSGRGAGGRCNPALVWKALERASCLASVHRLAGLAASADVVRAMAWAQFGSPFLAHLSSHAVLQPPRPAQWLSSSGSGDGNGRSESSGGSAATDASSTDQLHAQVLLALSPSASAPSSRLNLLRAIQAHYPYPCGAAAPLQEPLLHAQVELALSGGDLHAAGRAGEQLWSLAPRKGSSFASWALACFAEIKLDAAGARGPSSTGGGGAAPHALLLRLQALVAECLARFERGLALRFLGALPSLLGAAASSPGGGGVGCETNLHAAGLAALLGGIGLARALRVPAVEAALLLEVHALQVELGQLDPAEQGLSRVASILLGLCMPSPAASLQHHVLPVAALAPPFPCGDASVSALLCRTRLLQARVEMARLEPESSCEGFGDTGAGAPLDRCEREGWLRVVTLLREALAYACSSSDLSQLYYLLARAYDQLHMQDERNACAEQFCMLEAQC